MPIAHKQHSNPKAGRSKRLPCAIILDTETRTVNQQRVLRLGYALYVERPFNKKRHWHWDDSAFDMARGFWDFVEQHLNECSALVLTGYNLHYDLRIVNAPSELAGRGFQINAHDRWRWNRANSHFVRVKTILTAKRGQQTLFFIDMMQPGSRQTIEKLGRDFGIPKRRKPKPDASQLEWLMYCKRDVDIALLHWLMLGDLFLSFWFSQNPSFTRSLPPGKRSR